MADDGSDDEDISKKVLRHGRKARTRRSSISTMLAASGGKTRRRSQFVGAPVGGMRPTAAPSVAVHIGAAGGADGAGADSSGAGGRVAAPAGNGGAGVAPRAVVRRGKARSRGKRKVRRESIAMVAAGTQVLQPVYLLGDDKPVMVKITPETTVLELLILMRRALKIRNDGDLNLFDWTEPSSSFVGRCAVIDQDVIVKRVLDAWGDELDKSLEQEEGTEKRRLVYRRWIYVEGGALENEAMACKAGRGAGSGALRVLYHDAVYHATTGAYPIDNPTAAHLAALQLYVEEGPFDASLHTAEWVKKQVKRTVAKANLKNLPAAERKLLEADILQTYSRMASPSSTITGPVAAKQAYIRVLKEGSEQYGCVVSPAIVQRPATDKERIINVGIGPYGIWLMIRRRNVLSTEFFDYFNIAQWSVLDEGNVFAVWPTPGTEPVTQGGAPASAGVDETGGAAAAAPDNGPIVMSTGDAEGMDALVQAYISENKAIEDEGDAYITGSRAREADDDDDGASTDPTHEHLARAAGWNKAIDETSGADYWVNPVLRTSSWQIPPESTLREQLSSLHCEDVPVNADELVSANEENRALGEASYSNLHVAAGEHVCEPDRPEGAPPASGFTVVVTVDSAPDPSKLYALKVALPGDWQHSSYRNELRVLAAVPPRAPLPHVTRLRAAFTAPLPGEIVAAAPEDVRSQGTFATQRFGSPTSDTSHPVRGECQAYVVDFHGYPLALFRDNITGPLQQAMMLRLAAHILGGVGVLLMHGIVHLDLGLECIVLNADSVAHICNFGYACLVDSRGHATLSTSQRVGKNLLRLAPEVRREVITRSSSGAEFVDFDCSRQPVWAAGAVLYELATGNPPGGEGTDAEFRAKDLAPLDSAYPPQFRDLVIRMLSEEPHERPTVLEALSTVVELRASDRATAGAESTWTYTDDSGALQGPFPTSNMKEWHSGGFLAEDIALHRVGEPDDYFASLAERFPTGVPPFAD